MQMLPDMSYLKADEARGSRRAEGASPDSREFRQKLPANTYIPSIMTFIT